MAALLMRGPFVLVSGCLSGLRDAPDFCDTMTTPNMVGEVRPRPALKSLATATRSCAVSGFSDCRRAADKLSIEQLEQLLNEALDDFDGFLPVNSNILYLVRHPARMWSHR